MLNFGLNLNKWLSFQLEIGQANYSAKYYEYFRGTNYAPEYSIVKSVYIRSDYETKISSFVSNYKARLSSPYFWNFLGFYYEFGMSVQYDYESSLKEVNNYSLSSTDEGAVRYNSSFTYYSKNTSTDIIKLPFSAGVSFWITDNLMLEGYMSYRKSSTISSYSPSESTYYGLGLRFNPSVFKG